MCALGFTLNALPSNWLPSNWAQRALAALGLRSRDSSSSNDGLVSSLYQRARRATCTHLP